MNSRVIDMAGDRYGKWTVLNFVTQKGWRCVCDCGNTKIVSRFHLIDGKSTQCKECIRLDRTPTQKAQVEADVNRCGFIMLPHGKFVLADKRDVKLASLFLWHLNDNGYAIKNPNKKCRHKYLHRMILGAKKNKIVDHENRNKLDCRRSNLRFANPTQSSANSSKRISGLSEYRCVERIVVKSGERFVAYGGIKGKKVIIGRFLDAVSAALSRDRWALARYGKFAQLNFP